MAIDARQMLPYLWILLVALAIGAAVQFVVGPTTFADLKGDEGDYHRLAVRYSQSGIFGEPGEVAYRAPLYPIMLGYAYARLGVQISVARGMNWLLAGLMCMVAAMLAEKLSGSLKAAWLAAGLVCINSYWWLQQCELMPENLNAVLLGLAVWFWPVFSERTRSVGRRLRKHGVSVAAGATCLGLALLTKPLVLPAVILLPPIAAVFSPANQRQSQVAFALIFVLVAAIPLGAWSTRNYRQLRQWVPITTGSGAVFWGAHAPETLATAKGSWTNQPMPIEFQTLLDQAPVAERELLASRLGWEAGWHSLRTADSSEVLIHFALKPLRLWSPSTFFEGTGHLLTVKILLIAINVLTLASCLAQLRPEYTATPLAVTLMLSLTMTAIVFWGTIRFQYTLLPIIAAYASLAWYRRLPDWIVFQRPSRQRRKRDVFRETKFG